jgi:hypothetical protein
VGAAFAILLAVLVPGVNSLQSGASPVPPGRPPMASTTTAGGMRRVLALEGNIGAGKSTLLRLLKARGLWAVEEPVARWQSVEVRN